MRNLILVAAIASLPIAAPIHAQTTKAVVAAAAAAKTPAAKTDGGEASGLTPIARARNFVQMVRRACTLLENEGKLFAACDNTTSAARLHGADTYVPQTSSEWETFTRRLADADKLINDKGRPVVVLNGGDVVAEATSGGVVTLKR